MLKAAILVILVANCGYPVVGREVPALSSAAFSSEWKIDTFGHDLFDSSLEDHLGSVGQVDCTLIRADVRFLNYLDQPANTAPAASGDDPGTHCYVLRCPRRNGWYPSIVTTGNLTIIDRSRCCWA